MLDSIMIPWEEYARLVADSKRYVWMIDEGHKYHEAIVSTPSMGYSTGPYIVLDPPSCNGFSNIAIKNKAFADATIDECMAKQEQQFQASSMEL